MPGRTATDLFVNVALCLLVYSCCSEAQQQYDIRLVNGEHQAEGRVEIYYGGQWGTVCDDQFGRLDADVVCRELGFGDAVRAVTRAGFGRGTGQIWMDGVACRGNEKKLSDCPFNSWGINDCRHSEDVGVVCKIPETTDPPGVDSGDNEKDPLQVRLSCPPHRSNTIGDCTACYEKEGCGSKVSNAGVKGIVQVLIGNEWVTVSGKKWTIQAASTVCGQLGYPVTFPSPPLNIIWPRRSSFRCIQGRQCTPGGIYRRGLRTTVFDDTLLCTGQESNLGSCYYSSTGSTTGPIENVATVHCGYDRDRENSEHCHDDNTQKEIYRLRAGALPHIGRVEVKREGKWGTICDFGWDLKDATVVCRNLGYGSAKRIFTRAELGRGIGATVYSNLECRGNERLLSDCARTTSSRLQSEVESRCPSHTGDVGVECNVPQCPHTPSSRIRDGAIEINGRLGWGKVCDGTIDIDGAAAVCREDRGLFAKSISSTTDTGSGTFYKGNIVCQGEETRLEKCSISVSSESSCSRGVVNVVCTSELPDLVPNLEQFERSLRYYPYTDRTPIYYLQCAREEQCLSSSADNLPNNAYRDLLRFDSLTMNYGTTDFTPALDRSKWIWHSCHNHYHSYENFITYDILNEDEEQVAEGHKASFCLEDSFCATGAYQRYRCATGNQGISKNCGDLYGRNLDCQWIDISDNESGTYLLRQTVNAEKLTPETDYKNNEIECTITISGRSIVTSTCRHSDH